MTIQDEIFILKIKTEFKFLKIFNDKICLQIFSCLEFCVILRLKIFF